MNKASFDRVYKGIKGHLLDKIVVVADDQDRDIVELYWDEPNNRIVIKVTETK